MRPQGGATANASGSTAELIIRNQLNAQGLDLATIEEHRSARALLRVGHDIAKALLPNKFYRQLPAFKSLYGVPFSADFVINSPKGLGLIEMKWQVSAGSVDEKLPFWLLTIQQLPTSVATLLVAVGGGIRPGALEWLRNNAGKVMIAGDFQEVQKAIRATW